MGYAAPPEFLQLDGMTDELRCLLANLCVDNLTYLNTNKLLTIEKRMHHVLKKEYGTFSFTNTEMHRLDEYYSFMHNNFRTFFKNLEWHQRYSIIEILVSSFSKIEEQIAFIIILNKILEQENSGYRMNKKCLLVRITNKKELEEVEEAQNNNYETVKLHMNKAVVLFSDRDNPDYANAVKESISAVEALARHLTGQDNGKLGQLVKQLDLHKALAGAISQFYGWTNDDAGIRHALKDSNSPVDFDTAKFAIVTNSAVINFITAKFKK